MSIVIFLNDKGECRALTGPMPTIPRYPSANQDMVSNGRCWDRYEREAKAYEAALASAKESSVRVENLYQSLYGANGLWAIFMDGPGTSSILSVEIGQLYTLPDDYVMRVTKSDGVMESYATIYRVESPTKEEETPLSALRNKLGPFVNLAMMVREKDVIVPDYFVAEAERCDIEGLHKLLDELTHKTVNPPNEMNDNEFQPGRSK